MKELSERAKICYHVDDRSIRGFFGDHRYLSNYHICPVKYKEYMFTSSEAAYQAAKCENPEDMVKFLRLPPYESKGLGYRVKLKADWDEIKDMVMQVILVDKFTRNDELGKLLKETYPKYLEETNWWGDIYWGVCQGVGQNKLGYTLMKIREILK